MKKIIKWIIFGLFFILVFPAALLSKLPYLIFKSSTVYHFFAQSFSLIPGIIGTMSRAVFYKMTLQKSYLDLNIGFCSLFSKIESKVGKSVIIGGYTIIGLVEIGDYAAIANHVSILSGRHQHNFTDPSKKILETEDVFTIVKIGTNSMVGDHSVVMADIGNYSVIGASSNVLKPIPDYVLAVGNPAQIIKQRERR